MDSQWPVIRIVVAINYVVKLMIYLWYLYLMQQINRSKPTLHRVFFALWPDADIRQKIQKQIYPIFDHPQGRKVPKHNWHITLAFLGNVSDDVYTCIQQQADMVSGTSFEINLDTIGHWSRPKVAWLGCNTKPQAIDTLVSSLNEQLFKCGYTPEFKTFQPHMTLMRKVTRKPKSFSFKSVTWEVKQFVLVESHVDNTGSTYKVIKKWKLS